jgi:hypothetical protein
MAAYRPEKGLLDRQGGKVGMDGAWTAFGLGCIRVIQRRVISFHPDDSGCVDKASCNFKLSSILICPTTSVCVLG